MENKINIEVTKENKAPMYEQFKGMISSYSYQIIGKGQFYSTEEIYEKGKVYKFGIILEDKKVPLFGMDLIHDKLEGDILVAGQPGYSQYNRINSLDNLITIFNFTIKGMIPEIDKSYDSKFEIDGTLTNNPPKKH